MNTIFEKFSINKAENRATETRPGFISQQSFNFAGHYIKSRDGFGKLIIFNDDTVNDGVGIPMHPHENFEILSVILSGEMEHKDNLGNNITVHTNEVKLMSAGSGLMHGGICYSHTNFLQIWVKPTILNTTPLITVKYFSPENRNNKWQLQVSPDENDNVLTIKQAMRAYRGVFNASQQVEFNLPGKHKLFLMPLNGSITLNNKTISARDSAEFEMTNNFSFQVLEELDVWLMIESIN